MQWFFIDKNILIEEMSRFTIQLNAGTWREPQDITPNKTNSSAYEQAKLLRLGLEFAKEALAIKVAV
ncbi:MAG: hypothetical protein ACJAUP_003599 [Cellvibrionaceae bacterium]|jgi:hypothetical protein